MTDLFDNLLAGIHTPSITASALNLAKQPLQRATLALPMYDFQEDAVNHALRDTLTMPYGYIGLDMGLGKTPCGISCAAASVAAGQRPVLVVSPPAMRRTWALELTKFAPWLTVDTLAGAEPDTTQPLPDVDVLIIGSSAMTLDKYTERDDKGNKIIPPRLDKHGWAEYLSGKVAALVVDEAHFYKNKSTRSKALRVIAESVPGIRILMSGTPTPNGRHQELANQVDIMGDGAWRDIGGKGLFWQHYAPKVDEYSRINNDGASLFKAMSSTWFHRRLRQDVIDLPNKGRTSLAMEGRGMAVRHYVKAEADLIAYLREKQNGVVSHGQRRAQALIKLMTLRQLAGEAKVRATIEHVKEMLNEEPGGVLVVAEHSEVLDDLLIGLTKFNPVTVRGGQTDNQRQNEIELFTSGKSRVMVGQISAVGVGLTLHGEGINHRVVIAQLPWTPADLKQAEDRLHRIGQTHDVMIEVGLCSIEGHRTIDERLWAMLERKNFDASMISDGEGEVLLKEIQDGVLDSYR